MICRQCAYKFIWNPDNSPAAILRRQFSGGSSPSDNSPHDNSPPDNSPPDNSPAVNSPADNSPVDNSPADNMNSIFDFRIQFHSFFVLNAQTTSHVFNRKIKLRDIDYSIM